MEKKDSCLVDKINDIRYGEYTDYELTILLKELTNDYDVELLECLATDIALYLFTEIEVKESEFTPIDIDNQIKIYKDNGQEIPYIYPRPYEELTERQKEMRKRLEKNGQSVPCEPMINLERLLFPFEFYNVYRLQGKIISKLNEIKSESTKPLDTKKSTIGNKSLLLNGEKLNLSERYKIANKLLNIEGKIRTLKIGDLEKYQLLAYILGCDKDNARSLMNGTYNSKDRDLTSYLDELGLDQ